MLGFYIFMTFSFLVSFLDCRSKTYQNRDLIGHLNPISLAILEKYRFLVLKQSMLHQDISTGHSLLALPFVFSNLQVEKGMPKN